MNDHSNDFLKLVREYTENGYFLQSLYIKRAEIMLPLGKTITNIVDCEMNVTALMEKLMKFFQIQWEQFCVMCVAIQKLYDINQKL